MQAGESLSFFIIFFEKAFLSLDLGASFQGLLWRISNSSRIVGFLEYAMGTIQQTEGLSRKWDSFKRTALYFISKTYLLFHGFLGQECRCGLDGSSAQNLSQAALKALTKATVTSGLIWEGLTSQITHVVICSIQFFINCWIEED